MDEDKKTASSYGRFSGDTTRNEVQLDLNKFVDLLRETNELKERIRELEDEKKINRYEKWIDIAEALDAWRIFPRVFISIYMFLLYQATMWFMALPEPNSQQAALISTVVGAGAAWFGLYAGTGGKRKEMREYERP